ncbi:hypothetical protein DFH06DRAFT_1102828 [Mycena polygramma]|nr:hypothetical protein DFH06DRAFT_1102828 [Mycena polygramma]
MAPLPDVHLSYGPMLIGVFFNLILYGVFIGQALTYYQIYLKDGAWMRYFVLYLFVAETLNTGFDMAMMYQPLILEYGQRPDYFPLVFPAEPIFIVLVSTPIQIFFAWRIWTITKMVWVPVIISVFAVAALAGGLWTAIKITLIKEFVYKPLLHPSALLWFLASCVSDILITISLVMTLSHRKTGFVATDSVIDKIIRTTIQTGFVTSIFSVLDVICFMVFPVRASPSRSSHCADRLISTHSTMLCTSSSPYYSERMQFADESPTYRNFVWDLALSKLYSNALLSTLNARAHLDSISTSHLSGRRGQGTGMGQASGVLFQHGVSHGLVFEDMALVDGVTPMTTKFDEREFRDHRGRSTGDTGSSRSTGSGTALDRDTDIAETPRPGAGFVLYSGGSATTRGLEP